MRPEEPGRILISASRAGFIPRGECPVQRFGGLYAIRGPAPHAGR